MPGHQCTDKRSARVEARRAREGATAAHEPSASPPIASRPPSASKAEPKTPEAASLVTSGAVTEPPISNERLLADEPPSFRTWRAVCRSPYDGAPRSPRPASAPSRRPRPSRPAHRDVDLDRSGAGDDVAFGLAWSRAGTAASSLHPSLASHTDTVSPAGRLAIGGRPPRAGGWCVASAPASSGPAPEPGLPPPPTRHATTEESRKMSRPGKGSDRPRRGVLSRPAPLATAQPSTSSPRDPRAGRFPPDGSSGWGLFDTADRPRSTPASSTRPAPVAPSRGPPFARVGRLARLLPSPERFWPFRHDPSVSPATWTSRAASPLRFHHLSVHR
jgi:hypothetical protein